MKIFLSIAVLAIAGTTFLFASFDVAPNQNLAAVNTKLLGPAGGNQWGKFFYNAKTINIQEFMWAKHTFLAGVLSTKQYKTSGNKDIKFTESGWYAPSYSMPRSVLLDVDLNRKGARVEINGTFEGGMDSLNTNCVGKCITTERYHFSEFSIYLVDESGNRQGMRNLGTRDNVVRGNTRKNYTFTKLIVENAGKEIIVTDSSGFRLSYTTDFKYETSRGTKEEHRGGNYGMLNPSQKWFLGINCHVNGEGYCKLDVKEINMDF